MFPIVWIYWIASLCIVTYSSAYVVKHYKRHGFAALVGFYVIYLGASQIMATRIVSFDLGFYLMVAPASVFIYPFIAQATDMINEVYGRKMTQIAIMIAFVTQVLLVMFIMMINSLTPAPFFLYEEAWQSIFSLGIRVTIASWISYLISQNIDAYVFSWLKKYFNKRENRFKGNWLLNPYVWLRSIISDKINMILDSMIFVTLAFYGIGPVVPLMIGQIVSKVAVSFLDTPWFVWYKSMLKKS